MENLKKAEAALGSAGTTPLLLLRVADELVAIIPSARGNVETELDSSRREISGFLKMKRRVSRIAF